MIVTFHWRDSVTPATSYEMELIEFRRLASDFARFMQEGFPSEGIYICTNRVKKAKAAPIEKIHVNFTDIAVIT